MKLADLSPSYCQLRVDQDQTPDRAGVPIPYWSLMFDCPVCGPPYRIQMILGAVAGDTPYGRVWAASELPGLDASWIHRVTTSPSIDNTKAGHGRKHPSCDFHGHIEHGEIRFA